jgi:hypothetical protein
VNSFRALAEEALDYYGPRLSELSEEACVAFNSLEQGLFDLNKFQLKFNKVLQLFTVPSSQGEQSEGINKSSAQVNQMCLETMDLRQSVFGGGTLSNGGALLTSQMSPEGKILSPELLSPDETAHLLSNIFQRFKAADDKIGNQAPNPFSPIDLGQQANQSQNSFFQTFLSNEEYIKSAE